VAALWPSLAPVAHETERGNRGLALEVAPDSAADRRVPARSPEIVGPLGVYYFDYLERTLGEGAAGRIALAKREGGDVLGWEAFNLADGRRSVSEIRDVLTGRYAPVPLSEISEYFDLLARAKAVSWR
jgi:hypothetical protein